VLREVGGWDPYNVTEDADLGIRLARLGYRTDTIDSTTWEEAPVTVHQWLRQRTRWMKGWAQTFIVHMRHPLRLWRDLGTAGFFAFQILIGGALLSALVYPIFIVLVIHHAITGELFAFGEDTEHSTRKSLALFVLGTGYFGAILYGLLGVVRRGMPGIAPVLPTIPLYWVLLSAASWRALYQLIFDRYRWEKTEHGLARSSLRARRRAAKDAPAMRPVRDFVASRPKPKRL
jgi:glycosyltransferase XagB